MFRTHKENDYTYTLTSKGWSVELNEEVTDRKQTKYGEILEEIDGIPVTGMFATFKDCESLKVAPTIPSGITGMCATFKGCTSLEVAPVIPKNVEDISLIFLGCSSLKGEVEINAVNICDYRYWFDCAEIPITLTGTCPDLDNIASRYRNVTVKERLVTMEHNNKEISIRAYGDYIYALKSDGWDVSLNEKMTDREQTSYGTILESIDGITVTRMHDTFRGCTSLKVAPKIPKGVTVLYSTFQGCASLEVAPVIPEGVSFMYATFSDCKSLKVAPELPDSVTDIPLAFTNCTSLETAPAIPNSVVNMPYTVCNCSSLKVAPVVPKGVMCKVDAFAGCTSLSSKSHK